MSCRVRVLSDLCVPYGRVPRNDAGRGRPAGKGTGFGRAESMEPCRDASVCEEKKKGIDLRSGCHRERVRSAATGGADGFATELGTMFFIERQVRNACKECILSLTNAVVTIRTKVRRRLISSA
eukprot:100854-Prymnesium_polylepis.1